MDDLQTFTSAGQTPSNISESVKFLLSQLKQLQHQKQHRAKEVVHADEANQRAYFFYEKLRNAVEYKEQHLFLRNAIQRFLNRNLRLIRRDEDLAKELVVELIKTRYIANDSISVDVLVEVNRLLNDYKTLLDEVSKRHSGVNKEKIIDAVFEIASSDVERLLVSRAQDELFVNFTYGVMLERLSPALLTSSDSLEVRRALFISIHRLLLKSDVARIRYYLFYAEFSNWRSQGGASVVAVASSLEGFTSAVEKSLRSKLTRQIGKLLRRHIAPFRVLHRLVLSEDNPAEILNDRPKLKRRIENVCQSEYEATRDRVRTSVFRSIIFVFITKLSLAIILEIPYDHLVEGEVNWTPLAINLAFPPLYMLLIGLSVRIPSDANTKKIVDDIRTTISAHNPDKQQPIGSQEPPSSLRNIFGFLYLSGFVLMIYLLVNLLVAFDFNIVSGVLFFIFFSTVSFFGVRISTLANELVVLDERPGIIGLTVDVISAPFIRIGQWLSDTYSKINILNFALDVLIELPFKTILRIFDEWSQYLKEKRDDLL